MPEPTQRAVPEGYEVSSAGLFHLPDSDDYVKLFCPRDLHWGQPATIETIVALGREFRPRGYRAEVGNITGPTRKNSFSRTHLGGPFDLAYPFIDGASGAKDSEWRSDAPYRLSADADAVAVAAIDYGRLFDVLTWLVEREPVWQVLIGEHVMTALSAHCRTRALRVPRARRADGERVVVAEWHHHDDHIHVSIRNKATS